MRFDPIHTERLVLRPPEPDDVDTVWENRNDPEVAALEAWALPFPRERAEAMVMGSIEMGGPEPDTWWLAIIELHDGQVVGELAVHPTWGGRSVEIGYLLARGHWGAGYATEAVEALVVWLFDQGTHRVSAMLHPDNHASAMLLERTGFRFEGHTRGSFWVDDEVSDDLLYGMTQEDWEAWNARPLGEPDELRLTEITPEDVRRVGALETHHSQRRFVAPMGASFGDALFPEEWEGETAVPWLRAVVADGDFAGFVMVAEPTEGHPVPYLWRLLIDRSHQRRGIGRRVIGLLADQARTWGAEALDTSWEPGKGSPEGFYRGLGFEPTGRIIDGEIEARLSLQARS